VSTQTPLHVVWPAAQAHAPLTQLWPPPQMFMQKPQLSGSVCESVQL
jgi:hypothetical protein